jgi:adenylate cyclase
MRWPAQVRDWAREVGLALAASLAVIVIMGLAGNMPMIRGAENATLDMRFRLRGRLPPSNEVAVVLADDASLAALGHWPFPRSRFVRAVQVARAAGARVIVFDLLFAEKEEPVPSAVRAIAGRAAALTRDRDPATAAALQGVADADPDGELAAAFRAAGNVLLPIAFTFTNAPQDVPDWAAGAAYASFDKSKAEFDFPLRPAAAILPLEPLARAAAGMGNVNIAYGSDGTARYDYTVLPFDADFYPSLAVRAAAAYLNVPWAEVALRLGMGVRLGREVVPTDSAMRLLVNYRGPRGTIPTYSFIDLINGRLPADALRGRIVLFGASYLGNPDSFMAPFNATPVSGTERIATTIATILHHDFILEYPPRDTGLMLLAALLVSALVGLVAARVSMVAALGCAVVAASCLLAAAQVAFEAGEWVPLVQPEAALITATSVVLFARYRFAERQRRQVRAAFGRYMAPQMVEILAAHPERLRLGGETRLMTLLFCDIRGFTTISERYKDDPQALTHLINRFLTPMTDAIMARQGTIDKYIGDCIMAFWNAPLDDAGHAGHACASALAMQQALAELNAQLAAEAEANGLAPVRLAVGIGINSGSCVVGNMGSDLRFDYSVLGDTVNLAARLEGQSKYYRVTVVIGEATAALAEGWALLELDLIAVKGKSQAVRIYTLLGDAALAASAGFQAQQARHAHMLRCYRARDWDGALSALAECRETELPLQGLYDLYAGRIAAFHGAPPAVDWSGVYVAESK